MTSRDRQCVLGFRRAGFTLLEVAAALVIISITVSSVMMVMRRAIEATMDMKIHRRAFAVCRENMEILLSEATAKNQSEYGYDEIEPDIEWETLVEPFYEPVTDRMWARAVCSAMYTDSKGDLQTVELEHWLTGLNTQQVKQILANEEREEQYLEALEEGKMTAVDQAVMREYIKSADLDCEAYDDFIRMQQRKKLSYFKKNGTDGYEDYNEVLYDEEYEFLKDLGFDGEQFDEFYDEFVEANGNPYEQPEIFGIVLRPTTGSPLSRVPEVAQAETVTVDTLEPDTSSSDNTTQESDTGESDTGDSGTNETESEETETQETDEPESDDSGIPEDFLNGAPEELRVALWNLFNNR